MLFLFSSVCELMDFTTNRPRSVWTMAQRAGYVEPSEEVEQVLQAAQEGKTKGLGKGNVGFVALFFCWGRGEGEL